MLVDAKCIAPAWDSEAAKMYEPGKGPLPGGLYRIEREGKLAEMKFGGRPVKDGKDKDGNDKYKLINQKYVFEFDRAVPGSNNDYTCEKCGEKCKSLNDLGTHVHSKHPVGSVASDAEEEAVNEPVVLERRGKKKGRTFTCRVPGCGKILPNLYAVKMHKREHAKVAETEAVPA
jgi:hypothetical protein